MALNISLYKKRAVIVEVVHEPTGDIIYVNLVESSTGSAKLGFTGPRSTWGIHRVDKDTKMRPPKREEVDENRGNV